MSLRVVQPPRPAPMPFTRFVREVLGVSLTPGQHVLCAVAFDGLDPVDLPEPDRALAAEIFGPVERIPPEARHAVAALCGARSGKSYIFGALRMLHLALTVSLDSLAPGEEASGPIVCPDLRLARQTLRYVLGAVDSTPSIARLEVSRTTESITLRRPDGALVTIECLPATRGGSAVRGRTLVGACADEACFFRDSDYQVNDTEIYKAVAPRIVPDGQCIIASTPWAESGLLFDMWQRNHGHPVDAIGAHAPTTLLRSDAHTRRLVDRERERDADNATREFDAVPMGAGATDFFGAAIAVCIDESLPDVVMRRDSMDRDGVVALDTAFRRDASACVVATRHKGIVTSNETYEIRPPPGGHLVPSETIDALLDKGKAHGVSRVVADQHYIDVVRERARGMVMREAPGGMKGKVEVYTACRRAMAEGLVRIPAGQKRLLVQLRQVQSKPTPGGGLSISSPRVAGAHGDLASAFVLAVWKLTERATGVVTRPSQIRPPPDPYRDRPSTRAFEREERDKRALASRVRFREGVKEFRRSMRGRRPI